MAVAAGLAPDTGILMHDAISLALIFDGLWFLAIGSVLAGIVRGFTGFGTALVYLPFAGQVLGPFAAISSLVIMDLIGPLIHVPRALRDGHPGDVLRLAFGALLAVPLGVWVLSLVHEDVFRWAVSILALVLLAGLVLGLRYRGQLSKPMIFGTGALGGFMAGSVGIPGPPIIFLYMASSLPPQVIRANNMLYLILADLIIIGMFWISGFLVPSALYIGALMIAPYLLGNLIGGKLFKPELEHVYRVAAYVIIAGSALMGLPIWD